MEYAKTKTFSESDCQKIKKQIKNELKINEHYVSESNFDILSGNIVYYPPRKRIVLIDYSWGANFKFES